MHCGEVGLVEFAPARGVGADEARLAMIVSNDGANAMVDRLGRGVGGSSR